MCPQLPQNRKTRAKQLFLTPSSPRQRGGSGGPPAVARLFYSCFKPIPTTAECAIQPGRTPPPLLAVAIEREQLGAERQRCAVTANHAVADLIHSRVPPRTRVRRRPVVIDHEPQSAKRHSSRRFHPQQQLGTKHRRPRPRPHPPRGTEKATTVSKDPPTTPKRSRGAQPEKGRRRLLRRLGPAARDRARAPRAGPRRRRRCPNDPPTTPKKNRGAQPEKGRRRLLRRLGQAARDRARALPRPLIITARAPTTELR